MKRPKPRDYGLNSDHAPLSPGGANYIDADPDRPITQAELDIAAHNILRREAVAMRQRKYQKALEEYEYNNGWR